MKRWVGLGVIADNLLNIGRAIQEQAPQGARDNHQPILRPADGPGGFCFAARYKPFPGKHQFSAGK